MKVKVGRYVGDGANPRAFGGLGLAPDVVIISGADPGLSALVGFRDVTPYFVSGTGAVAGAIVCDDDGFTVSSHTNVNRDGTEYTYLAIEASGGDAAVGTYLGDGQDDHEITGLGFDPGFVLVRRHSTASGSLAFWRTPDMSAGMSCGGWFGELTGRIKALITDGFRLGTDASANANGATFSYLALADVEGWTARGAYTGNAQDDRNLDVIGWEPDTVIVKSAAGAGAAWRVRDHEGDASASWHTEADLANLIQALREEGFQVGTDARVNSNGQAYRWYALREGDTTAVAVEEKSGSDSAGATESAQAQEYTPPEEIADSDSAATEKEEAGYWRRERAYYAGGASGPAWVWVWRPGVEASHARQDSGAASESASIAHHQVESGDAGVIVDDLVEPPPVEHLRLEPAAAQDEAALWREIEVFDSDAHGEDGAVLELNPVGDSDVGITADAAETPLGAYGGVDGATGTEPRGRVRAQTQVGDSAVAAESAQRIILLSRHILACNIESSLDALADAFDLRLVESDSGDPLTPKAQAWRSFGEGDLVQVRLGLAGVGMDDYGVFRVDGAAIRASERELVTELYGRDRAALLVEERGRGAVFGLGSHPEQSAIEWTRPTCRGIAGRLAAMVGLGLVWEAPDYPLKEFALRADESIAAALGRLLEPLQVGERYRTDAWVEGDDLVVRRRGNGPIVGSLDCRLGLVRAITRQRQPATGLIRVWGGTETVLAGYELAHDSGEAGDSQVQVEDDGQGRRVVTTYLKLPDGRWVQSQEESEEQLFEEVFDEPRWIDERRYGAAWLGRLLVETRTIIRSDLHTGSPKTERRVVRLGHDERHRLVLREETMAALQDGQWEEREKSLLRYEQATPTDVRVTSTEWKLTRGELRVRSGFPKRTEQPGTLRSALHTDSPPDYAWDRREDGGIASRLRRVEETVQYRGEAVGAPGGMPAEVSLPNLVGHGACRQIAEDLAAESGRWRYRFELEWPRPFPYRKGDRVTLTGLPGEMADAVAIITRVRTEFDAGGAVWRHAIQAECWSDG